MSTIASIMSHLCTDNVESIFGAASGGVGYSAINPWQREPDPNVG